MRETDATPRARIRLQMLDDGRHATAAGLLVVIGLTMYLSWLVTRQVGGSGSVATPCFYLPILLCAYRFGRWPTLLLSLFAGYLSGPISDHVVNGVVMAQSTSDWVSRGIAFLIVGQVMAHLFSSLRSQRDAARVGLYDPLTGLSNRVLFEDRLDHARARLERSRGVLGVLMLDLDNFKSVNDELGRTVGDELLVAFSNRLRGTVRASETIGRLSADEFAIITEGTDLAGSETAAERIIESLRAPFHLARGTTIDLRASIGVADTTDAEMPAARLIQNADLAMYAAKRSGKNRYCVFDANLMTIGGRSSSAYPVATSQGA